MVNKIYQEFPTDSPFESLEEEDDYDEDDHADI